MRGVRPRGVDMVAAVSIQAGDAPAIEDNGPPRKEGQHKGRDHKGDKHTKPELHKHTDVQGVVTHILHGPKGEKRGALLEDGMIVRMSPYAAESLHDNLAPGRKLAARGVELTDDLGTVVDAHEIGVSLATFTPSSQKSSASKASLTSANRDEKPKRHEQAARQAEATATSARSMKDGGEIAGRANVPVPETYDRTNRT